MYEMTTSEGAIISNILALAGDYGGPGPARWGVPASTFYVTRRKMYEARWLTDRFVPNPWATGFASVECTLAKPEANERAALERVWARDPENVVLWSGLNSLFGVFFRRRPTPSTPSAGVRILATPSTGSLLAYFDYSRLWSRFIGGPGNSLYPRGLGGRAVHTEKVGTTPFLELLRRDASPGGLPPPQRTWHSPSGLPRSQRKLLDWGLVESRTFLNPESLPPYAGRIPGEVVFLTGRLRAGCTGARAFSSLNQESHVSPFLLMDDGTTLLIAALGQLAAHAPGRRRVRATSRPVLTTLQPMVENVQVTIERTDSLQKITDHRYDRLFS